MLSEFEILEGHLSELGTSNAREEVQRCAKIASGEEQSHRDTPQLILILRSPVKVPCFDKCLQL